MKNLASKMYDYLHTLNGSTETAIDYSKDDGDIIARLEITKLIILNLKGLKLTNLGESAILGDLDNFVKFYQRLTLQDHALSQENQNDKDDQIQ